MVGSVEDSVLMLEVELDIVMLPVVDNGEVDALHGPSQEPRHERG